MTNQEAIRAIVHASKVYPVTRNKREYIINN